MSNQNKLSKIAKDDTDIVREEDIIRDYTITQTPMIGSEIENFVVTERGDLITPAEHEDLKNLLAGRGVPTSDEPLASVFEIKTHASANPLDVISEASGLTYKFNICARTAGYIPLRTGYLGQKTLPDAFAHRLPFERSDGLLERFINTGQEMAARHPLMSSSVHVSLSFADIDDAYEVARIFMALTPSLIALCEETDGCMDGRLCRMNPSASVRLSHDHGRSGLPEAITGAKSAQDMIERHVRHLFSAPMMMHVGHDGVMRVLDDDGNSPSLSDLAKAGLNTRSNAMISESMQYHLIKLTSLRNGEGRMTGKRIELRMADNGPFQHDFMVLLAGAIGLDKTFRDDLVQALRDEGVDPFAPQTGAKAACAVTAVAFNRIHAMNVQMSDDTTTGSLAMLLCDMLESHYGQKAPAAQKALTLARLALTERLRRPFSGTGAGLPPPGVSR